MLPIHGAGSAKLPGVVYLALAWFLCFGIIETTVSLWQLRRWRHYASRYRVPAPGLQIAIWLALLVTAVLLWSIGRPGTGLVFLLAAQVLPYRQKSRPARDQDRPPAQDDQEVQTSIA